MKYVIAIMALASCAVGQTITGVSGTVAEDSTLTITGASFGTRTVESYWLEDFEWGSDGTAINTTGSPWSAHGEVADPSRLSNQDNRDNGGLNLRVISPDPVSGGAANDMSCRGGLDVDYGERVVVSMFVRANYAGAREFGLDCPQQWKIATWLNHYKGTAATALAEPFAYFTWNGAPEYPEPPIGAPSINIRHHYPSANLDTYGNCQHQFDKNEWFQFEAEYLLASGFGETDGYVTAWIGGIKTLDTSTATNNNTDLETLITNDGQVYSGITLRGYIQWSGCDQLSVAYPDTIRYDDVMVQVGTFARVALGNASTYDACTWREFQPVDSWANGSITVTVNQGSFQADDTAYLFVVTDTGSKSGGYPVTIGGVGGGEGDPPGPGTPDIQSATRSGGNASLTWLSGDGGPYTVWLQSDDVRGIVTTDTTITIPMSTAATDVTVKDGTSQRRANIPE